MSKAPDIIPPSAILILFFHFLYPDATSSGKIFRVDQNSRGYHFVMHARDWKITERKEYIDNEHARKVLGDG